MKFIAIEKEIPGNPKERFQPYLKSETATSGSCINLAWFVSSTFAPIVRRRC
jgi:hypothetical protein